MSDNSQQGIKEFVDKCLKLFDMDTVNASLKVTDKGIQTTVEFIMNNRTVANVTFFTENKWFYDKDVKMLQSKMDIRAGKY